MVSCGEKFFPVPVRVYVTSVENSMGKKCGKAYHRNKKEEAVTTDCLWLKSNVDQCTSTRDKIRRPFARSTVYSEKSSCQTMRCMSWLSNARLPPMTTCRKRLCGTHHCRPLQHSFVFSRERVGTVALNIRTLLQSRQKAEVCIHIPRLSDF